MGKNNVTRRREPHYIVSGSRKEREQRWGVNSLGEKKDTFSEGEQKSASERQRPQYISSHKEGARSHKRRHNDGVLYLHSILGIAFAPITKVVSEH